MHRRHAVVRIRALAALAALVLTGCGEHTEEAGRQAPGFPSVRLEVAERGSDAPAVRVDVASNRAPSSEAGGRRAWILAPLFGQPGHLLPTAELIVTAANGTTTRLPRAMHAGFGRVWVLRDDEPAEGTVEVALVEPGNPFAALPSTKASPTAPRRIQGVTQLRLLVQGDMHGGGERTEVARDRPAQIRALVALEATVDGKARGFEAATVEGLDLLQIPSPRGGDLQSAWDLRALVRRLAGADARLESVVAADGAATAVSKALWDDERLRPVLRLNRRGTFRFHWVHADGRTDRDAPGLRGARHLYIVSP